MRRKFIRPLPKVWSPKRRYKEKKYVGDVLCYDGEQSVDYISHSPNTKKLIKKRLGVIIDNGISLLQICDEIGYDTADVKAWLNSHSIKGQVNQIIHGAVISLLDICGYKLRVTIEDTGLDLERLEKFRKTDHDFKDWERRNAKHLP